MLFGGWRRLDIIQWWKIFAIETFHLHILTGCGHKMIFWSQKKAFTETPLDTTTFLSTEYRVQSILMKNISCLHRRALPDVSGQNLKGVFTGVH